MKTKKRALCLSVIFILSIFTIIIINGCHNRSFPSQPDNTSSNNNFTNNPTEDTTPSPIEPSSTEDITPPSPTPYDLIVSGTPVNANGDIFRLPCSYSENKTLYSVLEWQDGFLIAVGGYSDTDKITLYYTDLISNELFASATLPDISFDINVSVCENDNVVVTDMYNHCFYIYDRQLALVNIYYVSESFYINPIISEDGKFAYYSNSNASVCYKLTLSTGIITEIIEAPQKGAIYPCGIVFSGNSQEILIISRCDYNDGYSETYEYYDADTFELLATQNCKVSFEKCGKNSYGCKIYDNNPRLLYFPNLNESDAKEFCPYDYNEYYSYWFQTNLTLITETLIDNFSDENFNKSRIRIYDLTSGLCTYETAATFDSENAGAYHDYYISRCIYSQKYNAEIIVCENFSIGSSFYLLDLNAANGRNTENDKTIYLYDFTSSGEINYGAIYSLKVYAGELSKKYDLKVCIADEARNTTYDYSMEQIFETAVIRNALTILDGALSRYPENFFKQFNEKNGGTLEINLTGTISPLDGYDTISSAVGLHNYNNGSQYIVLDINYLSSLEKTIYHEIFHAMDWFIIFNSDWFGSDWFKLNPSDFEYDYGYESNQHNYDSKYLYYTDEGYFIDTYSKSFPNEDRARIIENAMDGNSFYFESEGLRNKLIYIDKAIRDVFDSSTWDDVTCWEAVLIPMPLTQPVG